MLNYKVKIGLVPMRRNTTNRPAKTFLTWVSAEERGHRFVDYIEKNFKSENVTFCNPLLVTFYFVTLYPLKNKNVTL